MSISAETDMAWAALCRALPQPACLAYKHSPCRHSLCICSPLLGACRELERTSTSARSAPAKDVARAAEGGDSVGRQSSNGATAPPEGLKARIQGLVQSLRAVTEVRMRHSSQVVPREPEIFKGLCGKTGQGSTHQHAVYRLSWSTMAHRVHICGELQEGFQNKRMFKAQV